MKITGISKIFIYTIFLLTSLGSSAQNKRWTLQTTDTRITLGIDAKGQLSLFELSNPSYPYN